MEFYNINGTEYEIYTSASGHHCVQIDRYGSEPEQYNCGSREDALEFILKDASGCWGDDDE